MAISDIKKPGKTKHGPTCGVCQALEDLPPKESAALLRLLKDKNWRYTELAERLRAENIDLKHFQIGNHVRGNCDSGTKLR